MVSTCVGGVKGVFDEESNENLRLTFVATMAITVLGLRNVSSKRVSSV